MVTERLETHIDSATPNEWNFVCWEIPNANFEQLNQIGMGPILLGCHRKPAKIGSVF